MKAHPTIPGQAMIAEQDRDVDDPQTAHEQHGGGNALHGKLEVRADTVDVVVDTQQKNEGRRHKDGEQRLQGEGRSACVDCKRPKAPPCPCRQEKERKMATPPRRGRGAGVQMTFLRGNRDPTVGSWRSRARTASVQTRTAALEQMSRGKCRSTNATSASTHADAACRARRLSNESIAAMPCG